MEYIVETTNLSKRFGKEKAVDNVDLKIKQGEIYGFLGPNGAGKTTTIRMLLGLIKPTSGNVRIFGQDIKKHKLSILKRVGSLVESPSYYPHLTARENLEVLKQIVHAPNYRIDEVLDLVRLNDAANKKVKGFSMGMKQRLAIAASLLHEPSLLVLDEPTNGLDPSGIIEIRNLIKQLPKKYKMTVLISSHLLTEIDQIATNVGIIKEGQLLFQGPITEMREKAKNQINIRINHVEKAWQALLAKGIQAINKDGNLYFQETSDQEVAKIVSILAKEGFSIYRVEEEKRSLEDIFLQMTSSAKESQR